MFRSADLEMPVRPAARLMAAVRTLAVAVMRRPVLGQLGQMDDRMLRDIGLTRQDLWSVAAEPLFRDPTVGLARRANTSCAPTRAAARERVARAELIRLRADDNRAA